MLKLKDINSENEATAEILNVSKLQSLEVLKLCTFYQRVAPALTNRQPRGYYSPHMLVPLSRNPQPQRQETNIHRHSQSSNTMDPRIGQVNCVANLLDTARQL